LWTPTKTKEAVVQQLELGERTPLRAGTQTKASAVQLGPDAVAAVVALMAQAMIARLRPCNEKEGGDDR